MEANLAPSSPDSAAFRHLYCRERGVAVDSGTESLPTERLSAEVSSLTIVVPEVAALLFKFCNLL